MATVSEENRNTNLKQVKKKFPSQENMVVIVLYLLGAADAETIWKKCQTKYNIKSPLTSIRRAVTNLKAAEYVAVTERTVHTDNQGIATVFKVTYKGEMTARALLGNPLGKQEELFNG